MSAGLGAPAVRALSPATTRSVALATAKLRTMSAAGDQSASPAWEAVTEQVPAPVMRRVTPVTEQGPTGLKRTAKPEVADADRAIGPSP